MFLVPLTKTENQDAYSHQQIRICISWKSHHLALEGYPALHHYSTRDEDHEILD
jgi:hypothetical protein